MNQRTFDELISRIADNNKNALDEFYQNYGKLIYGVAFSVCKNKSDSDEVVDEVLIKIWNTANALHGIEKPKSWLYRVTFRLAINKINSRLDTCTIEERAVEEEGYESRPQIVSINDSKKLIVWVGDNVLRSENNFTQLYYAVIENGEIGEPKVVYDDGTADFIPTLINKDGEIYLAWQNCNKVFNDDATILDVSSSLEIAIAKYDAESNQFCNITNKTNNNQLDAVPKFSKANGKLVLCWQANSESNLLFNTGVNYIYQSIFDGNNWSEPQMIMSTDSVIVDFDISNVDGESMLLYTLDMDEDLTTMDDRQVFIKSNTEKAIVEGVNLPKFENIDNKLGLYYLKDGKLYYISNINSSNLDSEQITGNFSFNFKAVIYLINISRIKQYNF